jgi:hypothetical protein
MAVPHRTKPAIGAALAVIQANSLSNAELEMHLESVWKSGYQAGRKALRKGASKLTASKVVQGVAVLKRLREERLMSAVSPSTASRIEKSE